MGAWKYRRPRCPRCGSYSISKRTERFPHIDTTGKQVDMIELNVCGRCGYKAHWEQFYESEQRKAVQKLFDEGQLRGQKYILIAHKDKK